MVMVKGPGMAVVSPPIETDARLLLQRPEAFGEAIEPRSGGQLRQREAQQIGMWPRALRREIGEIDGERLVPNRRRGIRGEEMDACDDGVAGEDELLPLGDGHDRGVVP